MLAPLIVELLIASLLFLLVGWISDILHASTHDDLSCLNSAGTIGWDQMRRLRKPLPYDNPDATWRARPVGRHRPPERPQSYPLSIGRLRPHGPEPRKCHDSAS
jgi:hypothetical protein